MYPNPLKAKLQRGELVLGTGLPVHDIRIAASIIGCGPDFVWIDHEHGPYDVPDLGYIPILFREAGIAPMVRVAWNDPAYLKKAYDAGAVAVMVPQVNSAEEAKRAIEYAKYPPIGKRGIAPHWVGLARMSFPDVILSANDETVLILQMESVEAYEAADEILALDNFDVLLVGPMDLSASLGVTAQMQDPKVQNIMREMPKRAEGTGKVIGTTLADPEEIRQKIDWGYRFLNLGTPMAYGVQFVADRFAEYREQAAG